MKDLTTRFYCRLIGWKYEILRECSEASRKALKRYAGAVILMMLLWGFIGFNMSTRYFGLEKSGAIIVAIVFSFVILLIEQQIILMVGKNPILSWSRFALAVCMSLIGATVIDQTIFGKDIEAQLAEVIEQRTDEQLQYRKQILDQRLASYHHELDSLQLRQSELNDAVNKQPFLITTTYNNTPTGQLDSLGNPIMARSSMQTKDQNPKKYELDRVNNRIETLHNEISNTTDEVQVLRDNLLVENKNNIGLLTELEVTFSKKVIFSSVPSGIFYFIVFAAFLMIELIVLSTRHGNKCDYEALIETRQTQAIEEMCAIMDRTTTQTKEITTENQSLG